MPASIGRGLVRRRYGEMLHVLGDLLRGWLSVDLAENRPPSVYSSFRRSLRRLLSTGVEFSFLLMPAGKGEKPGVSGGQQLKSEGHLPMLDLSKVRDRE